MPRRKRMPKHHLINFSAREFPQIMPWFKAQYNQKLSVYLLIRMAQRVGGNKDWPSVMQNLTSDLVVHDSLMNKQTGRPNYRFQFHNQPAHPYYSERRQFLKRQDAKSEQRAYQNPKTSRNYMPPNNSQPMNNDFDGGVNNQPRSNHVDDNTANNQVSNNDLKNLGIKQKWN